MTTEELVQVILKELGGKENVLYITNCMTRLRAEVKKDSLVNDTTLKSIEGVLGIVHDKIGYVEVVVGPGCCKKCADICASIGIPATADATVSVSEATITNDWKKNKETVKAGQKQNKIKRILKTFGEIFVPLIPGVITAGICSGIAGLLAQLVPNYTEIPFYNVVHNLLTLINQAFMTYLTAWAGYRGAEKFGATPILGGMLGMITTLGGIDNISKILGLYNEAVPLNAILRAGRGGVLAAVVGTWVLAKVEKAIRKRMPNVLDIVFTPLLTLLITVIPYIFVVMPATGFLSTALCSMVEGVCMSENIFIRMLAGFFSAALFLPMVAMGMHHGLVALYTVQLETLGFVTLYPALAMAGAGQVGAAIALYRKAKKVKNTRIRSVIAGAIPAGILGIGEPLIYGVTLPLGKPFLTAGLGAAFGGAFVMAMEVASTTWGPSGILALFVMTEGPRGAVMSLVCYGIGLLISYVMGFLITNIVMKEEEVAQV